MEGNKYNKDFEKRLCCKLLKIPEDSTITVIKQAYKDFTANDGELAKKLYGNEIGEKTIEFINKNISSIIAKKEQADMVVNNEQNEEIRRIFKPTEEERHNDELDYLISRYDNDTVNKVSKKIVRDDTTKKTKGLNKNGLMKKLITVILVGGMIATVTVACNSNFFKKDKDNSQITYVDSENQVYEFEVVCGLNQNIFDTAKEYAKANPGSNVNIKDTYEKGKVKILILSTTDEKLANKVNEETRKILMEFEEQKDIYKTSEGSFKR